MVKAWKSFPKDQEQGKDADIHHLSSTFTGGFCQGN